MTVPERLDALAAAWRVFPSGGILTLVETPNRLWFMDSHTSYLPFFNWLPDDLALRYSQFRPREVVRELQDETPDGGLRDLLRSGRGVSFHEFDLAIGPAAELDVISCLQLERRHRNPLRSAGWRLSRAGRYEAILRVIAPRLSRAFLQPFLYLSIRKPCARRVTRRVLLPTTERPTPLHRAGSTTGTAGSGGIRPASPPTPLGARAR